MNIKDFKHLFIPSTENGFKPTFLEKFSMGIMLVLVLLSFAMANIQALLWMGSDTLVSTVLPAVIVDLTNSERTDARLISLKRNETLDRAAKLKADDMAQKEYFAHYSPEGVSPWFWFDKAEYRFVHAGENLAVHFTDSNDVVTAWMNSPTHKANIMNGSYTEIGVGTARGEYKGVPTVFVVQLFGTPSASSVVMETQPILAVLPEATNTTEPLVLGEVNTLPNVLGEESDDDVMTESIPTSTTENVIVPIETASLPAEVLAQENIPSMYSDFASTSRAGIPAIVSQNNDGEGTDAFSPQSALEKTAIQPNVVLQTVYALLALLVVVALILSIVIEWRKQHPAQIAYAGGLLAVMAFLLHVHTLLTSGVAII